MKHVNPFISTFTRLLNGLIIIYMDKNTWYLNQFEPKNNIY